MNSATDLAIAVTVRDRASMERQLDAAVATAQAAAMKEGRHGVLVMRHSYSSFTVSVSDAVPFGLTRELGMFEPEQVQRSW